MKKANLPMKNPILKTAKTKILCKNSMKMPKEPKDDLLLESKMEKEVLKMTISNQFNQF